MSSNNGHTGIAEIFSNDPKEERLLRLENQMHGVSVQVAESTIKIDTIDEGLGRIENKIDKVSDSVDKLTTQVHQDKAKIGKLEEKEIVRLRRKQLYRKVLNGALIAAGGAVGGEILKFLALFKFHF